jgi:hypothetical protein
MNARLKTHWLKEKRFGASVENVFKILHELSRQPIENPVAGFCEKE